MEVKNSYHLVASELHINAAHVCGDAGVNNLPHRQPHKNSTHVLDSTWYSIILMTVSPAYVLTIFLLLLFLLTTKTDVKQYTLFIWQQPHILLVYYISSSHQATPGL